MIIPFLGEIENLLVSFESVCCQVELPGHVIVIDNNAVPEEALDNILESRSKLFRISVIRLSNQQNAACARNKGIKLAKSSSLIAFLDVGDVWHKNHLKEARELLAKCPNENAIYYCSYFSRNIKRGYTTKRFAFNVSSKTRLSRSNPIATSCVVLKLSEKRYFPETRLRHDLALWSSLIEAGAIFVASKKFLLIRNVESGSLSSNVFKKLYYQYVVYRKNMSLALLTTVSHILYQILFKLLLSLNHTYKSVIIKDAKTEFMLENNVPKA